MFAWKFPSSASYSLTVPLFLSETYLWGWLARKTETSVSSWRRRRGGGRAASSSSPWWWCRKTLRRRSSGGRAPPPAPRRPLPGGRRPGEDNSGVPWRRMRLRGDGHAFYAVTRPQPSQEIVTRTRREGPHAILPKRQLRA